jgi:hypothetical protein
MKAVHEKMQPSLDVLIEVMEQAHPGAKEKKCLGQFENGDDPEKRIGWRLFAHGLP